MKLSWNPFKLRKQVVSLFKDKSNLCCEIEKLKQEKAELQEIINVISCNYTIPTDRELCSGMLDKHQTKLGVWLKEDNKSLSYEDKKKFLDMKILQQTVDDLRSKVDFVKYNHICELKEKIKTLDADNQQLKHTINLKGDAIISLENNLSYEKHKNNMWFEYVLGYHPNEAILLNFGLHGKTFRSIGLGD